MLAVPSGLQSQHAFLSDIRNSTISDSDLHMKRGWLCPDEQTPGLNLLIDEAVYTLERQDSWNIGNQQARVLTLLCKSLSNPLILEENQMLFEETYGWGASFWTNTAISVYGNLACNLFETLLGDIVEISSCGKAFLPRDTVSHISQNAGVANAVPWLIFTSALASSFVLETGGDIERGRSVDRCVFDCERPTHNTCETIKCITKGLQENPQELVDALLPVPTCYADVEVIDRVLKTALNGYYGSRIRPITIAKNKSKVSIEGPHGSLHYSELSLKEGLYKEKARRILDLTPYKVLDTVKEYALTLDRYKNIRDLFPTEQALKKFLAAEALILDSWSKQQVSSPPSDSEGVLVGMLTALSESGIMSAYPGLEEMVTIKMRKQLNRLIFLTARKLYIIDLTREILLRDLKDGRFPVDIVTLVRDHVVESEDLILPAVTKTRHSMKTLTVAIAEMVDVMTKVCFFSESCYKKKIQCGKDILAAIGITFFLDSKSTGFGSPEVFTGKIVESLVSSAPLNIVHVSCANYSDSTPVKVCEEKISESFAEGVQTVFSLVRFLKLHGINVDLTWIYADDEVPPEILQVSPEEALRGSWQLVASEITKQMDMAGIQGTVLRKSMSDNHRRYMQQVAAVEHHIRSGAVPDVLRWVHAKARQLFLKPSRYHVAMDESQLQDMIIRMLGEYYATVSDIGGTYPDSVYITLEQDKSVVWALNYSYGDNFPGAPVSTLNFTKGIVL